MKNMDSLGGLQHRRMDIAGRSISGRLFVGSCLKGGVMNKIRFQTLTIACAIGWSLSAVIANAAPDSHSRNLTASCAACHGTNGRSVRGTPILAGMDKKSFVVQMKDFKSGARPATVMHQHAKGYSDEEFEKMAEFFAEQKR